MTKLKPGMTLRSIDPGAEHMEWTVVEVTQGFRGKDCVLQLAVKSMESYPSQTSLNPLLLLTNDNGNESIPSVREAIQKLHGSDSGELSIGNDTDSLDGWRQDIKATTQLIKGLGQWEER